MVAELLAQTKKALEEHSKRLLSRVKVDGQGFEQASKVKEPDSLAAFLRRTLKP